ncbi:hypothetical protein [Leifsonia aquatica]|uniref:hypothetical protein n=1 Tax=Leifsonia aquatica TaxID=144185 RepID=UPI00046A65B8|nr:hypothetical protein [Leifsonia aquatica]
MSQTKTYKHSITGKVGEFSDAVAALFPELEPIDAPAAEPIAEETPEPNATETEPNGGKHAASNRKKVAA